MSRQPAAKVRGTTGSARPKLRWLGTKAVANGKACVCHVWAAFTQLRSGDAHKLVTTNQGCTSTATTLA